TDRPEAMQKSVSLFIVAPRAQASRRCETQAPLRRHAAKLCYRFGPLTPFARSANLIAGDGMKNVFPAPNKEPVNPKTLLERKSPIQVRIRLPPAASRANHRFLIATEQSLDHAHTRYL